MNSTRTGKIARLPRDIRDQLNQRIDNGQSGPKLVAWLNALPEVQSVLAEHFEGRPIRLQNLSEWRQGGWQDWLQLQEKRSLTLQVFEQAETLDADATERKITAAFATIAATDFVHNARAKLKECQDTDERLEFLRDIELRLSRLRRDDCRAGHLKLRQDRWDHEVAAKKRADAKADETDFRRQMLAWFQLQPKLAEETRKRGGSVQARDLSALLLELEHNLKMGFLDRQSQEFAIAEQELDALKQSYRDLRATNLEGQVSEGRVMEPIIGRVPNSPNPNIPPASVPSVPSCSADPAPIALDNEIRPIDLSKMPNIRVNPAKNDLGILPKPDAIHRPCLTQSSQEV